MKLENETPNHNNHNTTAPITVNGNSRDRRSRVRVVTDSASQIDVGWAQANHVSVLAQQVSIDGHTFREGVDLNDDDLAAKIVLSQHNHWHRIEAPTVEDFGNVYRQLLRESSEIISVHVSSYLSNTVDNARTAAEEFRGRCNISIIDTQSVALGLNIMVRKIAQLAGNGMSGDEIVRFTRGRIKHIYGAFVAEDLQYMAHSGCLRPAQAALGKMLGVIPFLTIEEGQLVAIEKVRTIDRALEKLVEFAAEFEQPEEIAVLQLIPQVTDKTLSLMTMLRMTFPKVREIPLRNCGATIGGIIGPTGIGVMIYEG